MKELLFCFTFLCFSQIKESCAQADTNTTAQKNTEVKLYKYPTAQDLNDTIFNDQWLKTSPLSQEDINGDFTNINDLSWIKKIIKTNKIFLTGEIHYYSYISNLRNRLFFALNTYDYYPLIILENQYSSTPYVDYFLNIKDDQQAKKYFSETINHIVGVQEDSLLLEHIRRWNKTHQTKQLHIGFFDIEHDFTSTISKILIPYFSKIDSNVSHIKTDTISIANLEKFIFSLYPMLKKAVKKNTIGDFPFINSAYIKRVMENLESTYEVYSGKKAEKILEEEKKIYDENGSPQYYDFVYYRSKATVRNLTDTNYLGKYFIKNKVMMHAGERHVANHIVFPNEWNFLREGSYLSNEFSFTKNKTYSCILWGIALSLDKMKNLEVNSSLMAGAGEYNYTLTFFQKSFLQGIITANDYYIISNEPIDLFAKYAIKRTESANSSCVLVNKVDWGKIMNRMKIESDELYQGYKPIKTEIENFDSWIIVSKSPVIAARPKTSK